ncbi:MULTISPECIES: TetR/AcrR family transcriptional regulator [Paenibacillus]|jgi:AcrR family transcriptional regulator|uniref:TetR family transcriptional regulator n=2 Tax=Paenibacillus TaxID=44249 RepID=A0AAJ3J1X6_PAEPO|nr:MULTISPECIES: TetR/AcrR family transcriptional regulator [Paenibacillus]APB75867.1 nucleoid occlusion factor SlmA [Paenibacillus polymyxa]MBP1176526.1 AcrR family transcriptional regulator [Paenibacillus sp. PvR133]MCP3742846.1 TetR/AcrR family transcriptional regulator [Paenibacillus sp. A3M_27_13]MDH2331591.1 TetR/AcrR family transcriptional regulator [Paenibacillus polymyxa]MDR6775966.1 AcrR family transcriptional regulator [Paenibacillus peoriae]
MERQIERQHQMRQKLTNRLSAHVRKYGFQSLKMDEISRIMDVSRATLYKYFSTKEDIITFLVSASIEYIHEIIEDSDADQVFVQRFQQTFEQTIILKEFITDIFLRDLESSYPETYESLKEAMKQRVDQELAFYDEGIKSGVFNKIEGRLIVMQDEILNNVLDVKYLMENQLTVYQVLFDYYNLKKIQLFKPDKMKMIDDNLMIPRIEYMAQKISKNLY